MNVEVRLDDLLGRPVVDANAHTIGRIEEVQAERREGETVVTRYLIGTRALLERLSVEIWPVHVGGATGGYAARWDQVDISDPEHPRLTCDASELERI